MGIPLKELQLRVSSKEFALYWALDSLSPERDYREDVRMAIICQTLVQVMTGKHLDIDKFIPKFGEPEGQSPVEMMAIMNQLAARANKKKAGK